MSKKVNLINLFISNIIYFNIGFFDIEKVLMKKKDRFERIKKKSINKELVNDMKIRNIFGSLFMNSKMTNI